MTARQLIAPLLLALVVAMAGCGAPGTPIGATSPTTNATATTPSPERDVAPPVTSATPPTEGSPYAGAWRFLGKTTVAGMCSGEVGNEFGFDVTVASDGTFTFGGEKAQYRSFTISQEGAVTMRDTSRPGGCPEETGSGSCPSLDHCEGTLSRGEGNSAGTWTLDRGGSGGSPYAGTWRFSNAAATGTCANGAFGPVDVTVASDATFLVHGEKDQYAYFEIQPNGSVGMRDISPQPQQDDDTDPVFRCPRLEGSGSCASLSLCEGTISRGTYAASSWRLERVDASSSSP